MNWLFDYIPWYVWLFVLGGGGGVVLALIPGAFAALTGIWTLLPPKARWALAGIGTLFGVYIAGRYRGARNERDKNKDRADNAVRNRLEVDREVSKLNPTQVDAELNKHGDFRKD